SPPLLRHPVSGTTADHTPPPSRSPDAMLISNSDTVSPLYRGTHFQLCVNLRLSFPFTRLQFLSEMSKLFYANQTNGGSIYITMKRIDNSKKPKPRPSKQAKANADSKPLEP